MMPLNEKKLRFIFYSHPWSILQLDDSGLLAGKHEVLVELAQSSLLAETLKPVSTYKKLSLTHTLKRHSKSGADNNPRLFSIFPKSADALADSAERFCELSAPLILVQQQAGSPIAQTAGLLSALALPSRFNLITVLVHYQEAELYSGLFPYADEFNFLWDIADLPDKKLTDLSSLLISHHVTKERWGKFKLCHFQGRKIIDEEYRLGQYQGIVNEFFE